MIPKTDHDISELCKAEERKREDLANVRAELLGTRLAHAVGKATAEIERYEAGYTRPEDLVETFRLVKMWIDGAITEWQDKEARK